MNQIDTLSVNAIRILSADAIQKANSGHPGLPLGCAAAAYELWAHHMNHNPANPKWENRDRFILSGGHGSMLLYSLLHLFGYGNLSKEDLMNFRQLDSKTPGHPEYGHTVGVEATTGPLGAGMGMAVGMAMAEAHLESVFNKENYPVVDHYTYVLGGDGCMMEGISSEAFSLAGTLGLSKLIVLYDSNRISIEGSTDIAFRENVQERMQAFGFQTITVEDGNDIDAIGKAIEAAKADTEHPSFITIKTQIGFGCPAKQGKASAHGEPLGVENVEALRKNLNWPSEEPFFVPEEVYKNYSEIAEQKAEVEAAWNVMFVAYCEEYPEMEALWNQYHNAKAGEALKDDAGFWAKQEKPEASRAISGRLINYIKDVLPNLFGGSADLAPSNLTLGSGSKAINEDAAGNYIHYGVREFGMTAIANGISLHGGFLPYTSTFLMFVEYARNAVRMAALMKQRQVMVYTHDSIGLGEDGPTHQPVEQVASLRVTPNMSTWRPCDQVESAIAWKYGVERQDGPTALILSRQNLAQQERTAEQLANVARGGYVLKDCAGQPELIFIATGSEVELAVAAWDKLTAEGVKARVVSMPSTDAFDKQDAAYRESVLPKAVTARVAVEAGIADYWFKYVGLNGAIVGMTTFGESAPAEQLFEEFGFTVDNVVAKAKALL